MSWHSPIYCKWPQQILILSIEAAYIPWPLSFSYQRIQKWSHPDNRHYLWGQIESYWKDRESVTHHTYTKPGVAYWLKTFFALLYWNDAFDKSVELICCWAYPCFRVIFFIVACDKPYHWVLHTNAPYNIFISFRNIMILCNNQLYLFWFSVKFGYTINMM